VLRDAKDIASLTGDKAGGKRKTGKDDRDDDRDRDR